VLAISCGRKILSTRCLIEYLKVAMANAGADDASDQSIEIVRVTSTVSLASPKREYLEPRPAFHDMVGKAIPVKISETSSQGELRAPWSSGEPKETAVLRYTWRSIF